MGSAAIVISTGEVTPASKEGDRERLANRFQQSGQGVPQGRLLSPDATANMTAISRETSGRERMMINRRVMGSGVAAAALAACLGVAASGPAYSSQSGDTGGDRVKASFEQLDIDVTELPPQAMPPAEGDTDWPFYNRTIDGDRFSPLSAINEYNVGDLEEVCRVRVSGAGPFSAGTILVNGMLFTTAARSTLAIEPTNCEILWKSIYALDQNEIYNANRGVAYRDGRLFRGTGDGRLVAYDASTGRELWRVKAADPAADEYVNAAPATFDGLVFIGIAAGDLGIAGRMMAFDAKTGAKVWTFNIIPRPGEFGNDSWPGETWKSGGGGTWSSYTIDPRTGELFIPVANPAPTFDAAVRRGANLFTGSTLVLDARTGRYVWHFQGRPNDNHDYGMTPPPILLSSGGRNMVVQASKDGFVYAIDRKTRKLAWKAPVTTILNHNVDPTPEGVRVCPGAKGGVEYSSPAYDPRQGVLVVGAVDWCYRLSSASYGPHVPGNPYLGGKMDRGDPVGTGWITALNADTGKLRWRFKTPAPVIGAITPTAGNITIAGDASGLLYLFRTSDGTLLRTIRTGGAIAGGIITYQIRGQQYVAVSSGNVSRSSWSGATGIPTQIIYRLKGNAARTDNPADLTPDADRGRTVFAGNCAVCHGARGQGGEGPPLQTLGTRYTQAQMVAYLIDPRPPMPRLYPDTLNAQDVADVAAFARTLTGQ